MNWQPIDQAPQNTKEMFVVIALGVSFSNVSNYTSDPYCVWSQDGKFMRWPHEFSPTHFCTLPSKDTK